MASSRFLIPRNLLLEFLGAFSRRLDGWVSISGLIAALRLLDLDEASIRTGVSRLKKRGWLVAERRGDAAGYLLSARALAAFESGDTVIWHSRAVADLEDGWVIVAFSIPESQRSMRHLLKARLTDLGFGHVGPGMLLAPHRMAPEGRAVIDHLGVGEFVDVFHARSEPEQDIAALVRRGWDHAAIGHRYQLFVEEFSAEEEGYGTLRGEAAFIAYMRVLNWWRPIPFLDPGLPLELVGPNWPGENARRLFERSIAALEPEAQGLVAGLFDEQRATSEPVDA